MSQRKKTVLNKSITISKTPPQRAWTDSKVIAVRCRIKLRRTGSVLVSDRSGDAHQNQGETIQNCLSVNPWSFKVHKEGLKRHLHSNHRVVQSEFDVFLLEIEAKNWTKCFAEALPSQQLIQKLGQYSLKNKLSYW